MLTFGNMENDPESLSSSPFAPFAPAAAILVLLLLAIHPPAHAQSPRDAKTVAWWNDAWSCRWQLALRPVAGRPASPFVAATFPTLGATRPDGADIRVVRDDGRELPRAVLAAGFEDRATIAFASDDPKARVFVYFGNPAADAPAETPEIRAGLVLEVREMGKGRCDSWEDFSQLLAGSTRVEGRGLHAAPQMGFNPYGPGSAYVAAFTGWLDCPDDGEYRFATNSWDGSFLCIDGKLVVAFPGWHRPDNGQASHQGTVTLTKGAHRFDYYNAISDRGQGCDAGWQPPGENRIAPIPAQAFVGGSVGQPARLERRGDTIAAAFDWQLTGDLGTDDREVVAVQFRDASTLTEAKRVLYEWDFGDGVRGIGKTPVHVYLENGVYSVRMQATLANGATSLATMKVAVHPLYSLGAGGYENRLAEYFPLVKDYEPAKLSARATLFLGFLARETRHDDAACAAWDELFRRAPGVADPRVADAFFQLADLRRDRPDGVARALEVLRLLDSQSSDEVQRVRAKVEIAEVLIEDQGDLDAADRLLADVLNRSASAPTDYVRLAQVRKGEVLLLRGDVDPARAALQQAEKAKAFRKAYGDVEIEKGDHEVAFAEHLDGGEFDFARKELEALVWKLPTILLEGKPYLMRAEMSIAAKRPDAAARDLERFLKVNPGGNRAPEALLMLGQCQATLGHAAEARASWSRILSEHAHSVEASEAEKRLAALK